jgi:hypothetical protein
MSLKKRDAFALPVPGDPSGYRALIGLFDDAQSPGDVSARHDVYLGEDQEKEYLEQFESFVAKTLEHRENE